MSQASFGKHRRLEEEGGNIPVAGVGPAWVRSKEASVADAESGREGENHGRRCPEGKRASSHGALRALGSERGAAGELRRGVA